MNSVRLRPKEVRFVLQRGQSIPIHADCWTPRLPALQVVLNDALRADWGFLLNQLPRRGGAGFPARRSCITR